MPVTFPDALGEWLPSNCDSWLGEPSYRPWAPTYPVSNSNSYRPGLPPFCRERNGTWTLSTLFMTVLHGRSLDVTGNNRSSSALGPDVFLGFPVMTKYTFFFCYCLYFCYLYPKISSNTFFFLCLIKLLSRNMMPSECWKVPFIYFFLAVWTLSVY